VKLSDLKPADRGTDTATDGELPALQRLGTSAPASRKDRATGSPRVWACPGSGSITIAVRLIESVHTRALFMLAS